MAHTIFSLLFHQVPRNSAILVEHLLPCFLHLPPVFQVSLFFCGFPTLSLAVLIVLGFTPAFFGVAWHSLVFHIFILEAYAIPPTMLDLGGP